MASGFGMTMKFYAIILAVMMLAELVRSSSYVRKCHGKRGVNTRMGVM